MRLRLVGICLALMTFAFGCGQKPGVSTELTGGVLPPGATVNEQGQIVDAQGNVIGSAADLTGGGVAVGGIDPGGAVGGSAASDGANAVAAGDGLDESSTSGNAATSGSNSTGVTGTTIKLGAHAPLTGAAPIPSASAQRGNDLYFKWLRELKAPINGRYVDSMLKNDNYNPSQAVAVCKEMVEKDEVFLLYGHAGTDQIQACARYAAAAGVPYLSAGVTENGLTDLPNYFALSLSYAQQAPLLADMLLADLDAKNEVNGMLRFETPNFEDGHQAFVEAMQDRGAPLDYDRAVSKGASQTEAQTVVQEMKAMGIENVYVLTSPVWFLQVLQAARSQNYEPQWVGVGITKALDTVANVGCRNGTLSKARFFSPFPAWSDIDRFDPEFYKAAQSIYPDSGKGDDIMLVGWGMGRIIAELLEAGGKNLTREGFIAAAQRAENVKTGVFPSVSYTPTDHFGGSAVHVNEAHCSGYKTGDNRWHTIKSNVSDF